MNTEKAEDVLMHKKLLHMARDACTNPAVEVRLVQVCHMKLSFFIHSKSIFFQIAFWVTLIFLMKGLNLEDMFTSIWFINIWGQLYYYFHNCKFGFGLCLLFRKNFTTNSGTLIPPEYLHHVVCCEPPSNFYIIQPKFLEFSGPPQFLIQLS